MIEGVLSVVSFFWEDSLLEIMFAFFIGRGSKEVRGGMAPPPDNWIMIVMINTIILHSTH